MASDSENQLSPEQRVAGAGGAIPNTANTSKNTTESPEASRGASGAPPGEGKSPKDGGTAPTPSPTPQPVAHQRIGYGKVLAAMIVLLGLQTWLGHTYYGQYLELKSYSYLEHLLPDTTPQRLPVTVLDISNLPGGTDPDNLGYMTPRGKLLELLWALHDAKAAAIGIDIDFSPGPQGVVGGMSDFDFFDLCTRLGTPVYLGVNRMDAQGAAAWLGVPAYSPLAAGTAGVEAYPDEDILLRILKDMPQKTGTKPLPSMGEALASAYLRKFPEQAPKPPISVHLLEDNADKGYLVNYSKVGQLARERSSARTYEAITGTSDDFADKIVILGDLSPSRMQTDSFLMPTGEKRNGVLYQASTVYTLAVEPLYELATPVRLLFDFVLTLPFFVAVYVQNRMRATGGTSLHLREKLVEGSALLVALFLSLAVGGFFILKWRILWLEALLAGFALLLHGVTGEKLQAIVDLPLVARAKEATFRKVRKIFGRTR